MRIEKITINKLLSR